MRRRINIISNIDWLLIVLYLLMVFLGWINIYAAEFNEEHTSMIDMSQRYGMQFFYIMTALIIAFIVITHFLFDLGKLYLTNPKNYRWLFVADQILHLLVLGGVVYWIAPFPLDFTELCTESTLLFITFLVFVTYVSGIIMRMLLAPYIDEVDKSDEPGEGGSLKNAGTYIGMLERLFVFGFILMQQWAAIGLLIAAKSVFRFGDLNKGKNRKLTEYVLIGTLLSFGLAMLSGMCYQYLADLLTS